MNNIRIFEGIVAGFLLTFMVVALINPAITGNVIGIESNPGFQNCWAEDAADSQGAWNSACFDYQSALISDDESYEIHQVRKQGNDKYWAGLKISSSDNSVTDCSSIKKAYFCYKWWSETSRVKTCDISVDADNGASYTALTTECPEDSEPESVACTDITALENWTCNTFFGPNAAGALAKSEAIHKGTGLNGYYNISWDVFYFNVSYIGIPACGLDLAPESPQEYGMPITISCSCTNPETTAKLYRNETDVTNENHQPVMLPAGTYIYNCTTPMTDNYISAQNPSVYQIDKSTPLITLTANPPLNETYGTPINISCSSTNLESSTALYKNGIDVTSENNQFIILAPGAYEYVCSINETQNYNYNSKSETITVNKAPSVINLSLNGIDSDTAIEINSSVDIIGTLIMPSDGYLELYQDSTLIANGSNSLIAQINHSVLWIHNITLIYQGNENYSSSSKTNTLSIIDTISPICSGLAKNSSAIYQNDSVEFTADCADNVGLSGFIFSIDQSNLTNSTFTEFNGTTAEIIYVITAVSGANISWRFYANDSSNNWNAADIETFTVASQPAVQSPDNGADDMESSVSTGSGGAIRSSGGGGGIMVGQTKPSKKTTPKVVFEEAVQPAENSAGHETTGTEYNLTDLGIGFDLITSEIIPGGKLKYNLEIEKTRFSSDEVKNATIRYVIFGLEEKPFSPIAGLAVKDIENVSGLQNAPYGEGLVEIINRSLSKEIKIPENFVIGNYAFNLFIEYGGKKMPVISGFSVVQSWYDKKTAGLENRVLLILAEMAVLMYVILLIARIKYGIPKFTKNKKADEIKLEDKDDKKI